MVDVYTSIRSEVYTSSGISIYFAPATYNYGKKERYPRTCQLEGSRCLAGDTAVQL